MRVAVAVPAALFVGAFLAHFLLRERGLVVIGWREYVLETSVPVLLMTLVLLYGAIRGLVAVVRAPRRLGEALADPSSARWPRRSAGAPRRAGLQSHAAPRRSRGRTGLRSSVEPSVSRPPRPSPSRVGGSRPAGHYAGEDRYSAVYAARSNHDGAVSTGHRSGFTAAKA